VSDAPPPRRAAAPSRARSSSADAARAPALTPEFFRSVWGRLVGLLTRSYRLADPSLAEDAVQHALLQATRAWPLAGQPAEPVAWLTTAARNHLIDALRARPRERAWDDIGPDDLPRVGAPELQARGELNDDELALLFACCEPALPMASQVALALKVVCGFSLREIAAGLLTDESALAQRLVRARRTLAERGVPIELPAGDALAQRREAALNAVHLLFSEGYAASGGEDGQRPDLCREAIRLARAVAAHPATAHPDADALAALLLLHGARLPGRIDAAGDWLLLDEQDRAAWDMSMVAAGLAHLQRAQRADVLSAWHLRAGIASEHVTVTSYAQTRWREIVALYELLLRIDAAPTTRLAHAIAVAQVDGAARALPLVDALLPQMPVVSLAYAHASRARLLRDLGRIDEAIAALDRAIACAPQAAARRLLQRQRAELG
jgi:RNA polymerase sigma-70 factor (ECF subfamily)